MRDLDNDYKCVIEDLQTGAEMIAEIPDPDLYGPSRYKAEFLVGRHMLDSLAPRPLDYSGVRFHPPVTVQITGIGFFDQGHYVPYQGSTANNHEIHPVLSIPVSEILER